MKYLKNNLPIVASVLVGCFAFVVIVNTADALTIPNPLGPTNSSLLCFVKNFVDILLQIGVVIIAFYFMYSGYNFVTARGDTGKLKEARHSFYGAVIGGLIVLGAWVIINVLVGTVNAILPNSISIQACP